MTGMVALARTAEDVAAFAAAGVTRAVVRSAADADVNGLGAMATEASRGRCSLSLWWTPSDGSGSAEPATVLAMAGADELWTAGREIRAGVRSWAVVAPGDEAAIDAAGLGGRYGVVVHGKGVERLLQRVPIAVLERQRRRALAQGLRFGLSGPMEAPDVPRLLALSPDILVLDDLLRDDGTPRGSVSSERVRIARALAASAPGGADAPGFEVAPLGHDRIFVRDWIVPLQVGAYLYEREPQRVRFTVEAEVARWAERPADMRDVVTYDLIVDAIARATVTHVALVETIAEDVAAMVLAHPRVSGVDVTVEKLDLGPGSLGCRIKRRRAS